MKQIKSRYDDLKILGEGKRIRAMTLDFSEVLEGKQENAVKSNEIKGPEPATPEYHPVKGYAPLDLERAKKNLSVYDKKIKQLKREMDHFVVDTDRAVKQCTEMVSLAANLIKTMESNRKGTIQDADTFVRAVNRFVKIYRDQVDAIVKGGKKKIGDYEYQKELKRRELQKKAQDEADKLQASMDKRAEKAGIPSVKLPIMVSLPSNTPVRTESGSASTRMVWTWESENANLVPDQYLMINPQAIDAAVKAGIREIPGIRIFEKPEVRIRTA